MDVKIIATHHCSHFESLQHELRAMGVMCEVLFVEEHPDLVTAYSIQHSPNILVNDEIVFRGQPDPQELRQFFSAKC